MPNSWGYLGVSPKKKKKKGLLGIPDTYIVLQKVIPLAYL